MLKLSILSGSANKQEDWFTWKSEQINNYTHHFRPSFLLNREKRFCNAHHRNVADCSSLQRVWCQCLHTDTERPSLILLAVAATSYMEGSQPFIYSCAPRGTRTGQCPAEKPRFARSLRKMGRTLTDPSNFVGSLHFRPVIIRYFPLRVFLRLGSISSSAIG